MPLPIPSVTINVVDNGANAAISLPISNVQLVIGWASSTATTANNVPVAGTQPSTFQTAFQDGPLVEAAGLVASQGGTVVAISVPLTTKGSAQAVQATVPGGSTSVITTTLDATNGAWDDCYVLVKAMAGGTISTAGIQLQISYDAGRNFGFLLNLGTATTLAIGKGITLNFAAGTIVAGDTWRFQTIAPQWGDAAIQAAINAFAASQYGISGVGSVHIVGVSASGDATAIAGYLATITNQFIYNRAILDARDALAPAAWGGSGETETTWMNSLSTAFAGVGSVNTERVCVGGGHYNTPSPYLNAIAGAPSYRRPGGWSDAARRVKVPPQRKGGAVSDGALSTIVVNPATDPGDGFIYHDERVNPGLNAARFLSLQTWPKKPGFFVCHENLMCPNGSQFFELVYGNVIDVASFIAYATGSNEISDDLRLTAAGTLFPGDALAIQGKINAALNQGMVAVQMVSQAYCVVSQSANVLATSNIPITITIVPRGYANSITFTINLASG